MSPGQRCDEILQLIDEVLGDTVGPAGVAPLAVPVPVPAQVPASWGRRPAPAA